MRSALIGNPNTGKTSLFNQLTTSYAYVGNWSGVTVEKKIGQLKNGKGELIDLPGLYSLTPLSKDEVVVSQFLLTETYTNVINIIDASQLQRNLHVTLQLLELEKPLIIGLNMIDVAKANGLDVDPQKLAAKLKVLVKPIVARTGQGCSEILTMLEEHTTQTTSARVYYGKQVEAAVARIASLIKAETNLPKRWLALQLFEGNEYVYQYLQATVEKQRIDDICANLNEEIQSAYGVGLDHFLFRKRNEVIQSIIDEVVDRKNLVDVTVTERIDMLVTHRMWGIPIFLLLMFLVFMLTFDWLGFPLSDLLDQFISGPLTTVVMKLLVMIGVSEFLTALIVDGIIVGVGGVLVFIPQIFIMYLFISFLEDSGYMARVAFVMDRFMERIGLNGKAFIPMIIGFGCNVPGVMAARTIEQEKERLLTIILMPLMSCSARLPVYALFAGAFFVKNQAYVVFSLYLLGIVIALVLAKIFSETLFKKEASMFVIELPPYRLPHWYTLSRSVWDKGKGFLKKAGTVIFAGSVFIWLLTYIGPAGTDVTLDQSYLAVIGRLFAPLFEPLGFGTWQASAALLTGVLAKEVVVSTLNILYFAPDIATLQASMATHYTALSSYTFMLFVLLYTPCIATIAMIKKETGSGKWTILALGYSLLLGYVLTFIVYQVGSIFV